MNEPTPENWVNASGAVALNTLLQTQEQLVKSGADLTQVVLVDKDYFPLKGVKLLKRDEDMPPEDSPPFLLVLEFGFGEG